MRDVSQRALGAMLGMTKKNGSVRINRYEQQSSRADMETAAAIAKALSVPLAFLFAQNDREAELLLLFDKLSQTQQGELLLDIRKTVSRDERTS